MPIEIYLGTEPKIAATAWVHESATIIGKCDIGEHTSIWPGSILRGDVNTITIGENTNIQDGTIIHVTHKGPFTREGKAVVIGSNVTIGHGVILHACDIEDYAFVGIGSTVLDGAVIRSGAMIGACALVTGNQDLAGGFLYLGQPAIKVRALTEEEQENIKYSAAHYVQLANNYK
jgi:carbonic anhydrase/acetyltransferase-like protein (isoleucine patch superfamily)